MAAITITALDGTSLNVGGDAPTRNRKVGIAGAAGGVYVGPLIQSSAIEPPSSPTHATGVAAGGVEDSTGSRESDTYDLDASSGGMVGSAGQTVATVTRPTGRTAYIAKGHVGGSVPGYPAQRASQHATAKDGSDGAGNAITGAFLDKRSMLSEGALGIKRKTTVDGETVTKTLPRPTLGTSANPSAGTVALIDGGDALDVDLHADDITGGASGYKGVEIAVFARGTDTDEDGDLITHFVADGGTDATEAFAGAATGAAANPSTVAFYARFRVADANGKVQVGPWSARGTLSLA